jgi:hypothetical protein
MYKIILTLIILCYTSTGFSQKFTLSELVQLNKSNWDYFDTYVLDKGYEYNNATNNDSLITKYYSNEESITGKAQRFIRKSIYSSGFKYVEWQTAHKSEYLLIKKDLKSQGYKYIGEGTIDDKVSYLKYLKVNIIVMLFLGKADTDAGYQTPTNHISVENKLE